MASPRIHIYGLDELDHKLDRVQGAVKTELIRATKEATAYTHSQIPAYPAPPLTSTYQRTGTLGRQITEDEPHLIGSDIVGSIGTVTIYAPWVISDKAIGERGPQAWMHVGRWWTLQQVVRDAREGIVDIYRQAVDRLLKR